MTIDIRPVDAHDDAALRGWWEVGAAASAERPHDPWPVLEQLRRTMTAPNPERAHVLATAHDGDRAVGTSQVVLPLNDNQHLAYVEVLVRPDARRRGVGRALLQGCEAVAREAGRDTVNAEVYRVPGTTVPGEGFCAATGYQQVHLEGEKVVELARLAERRARIEARIAERIGDHTVVTWRDRCPDHLLAGQARLLSTFMSQIPLGELDIRDSEWTPERLRAWEERSAAIGQHYFGAAALSPDGEVVGLTDVRVHEQDQRRAQVGITIVEPEHRGHALGLAMKLATHVAAVAAFPTVRTVSTSNADVNVAMNAVNDAMGYELAEELLEVQKRL